MEKQNTSLFTRLKLYYKKKPVRVIIALIIIAGIMTGVAFGIIALVRALNKQDPCAKEPGKIWNEDAKMCVDVNCKNVCNKDGTCLDNYCDYSTSEGYIYDIDKKNCGCFIKNCDDGNHSINTKNTNISYTKMHKSNPNDPHSKLIPDDNLTCGSDCKFSNKGYCDEGESCKISITKDGSKYQVFDGNSGCYGGDDHHSDFNTDLKWTTCDTSNVMCGSDGNTINYECSKSNIFSIKEGTFHNYCKNIGKCGDIDSENKVICYSDNECGNGGKCLKLDRDGTTSHSELEIFEKKGINYLGICSNSNDIYNSDYCVHPKLVGEREISNGKSLAALFSKARSGQEGISLNQPQCIEEGTEESAECPKGELKNNAPWFCDYLKDGCSYLENGSMKECPKLPTITTQNIQSSWFEPIC